jgi:hypothetical protein
MASMIGAGMDWNVRKMYDSLRVELQEGKIVVHARLNTHELPPGTLGPFAAMFGEHEPLRMGGTIAIERPGTGRLTVTDINLRGFEIPSAVVHQIAKQMAGASSGGGVPLKLDPTITDVAVHPSGVVLYKRRKAP